MSDDSALKKNVITNMPASGVVPGMVDGWHHRIIYREVLNDWSSIPLVR